MNSLVERRQFLYQSFAGIGAVALSELLTRDLKAEPKKHTDPLSPKKPHHVPKVKSCIFLTMLGGVSQLDTFDPKPLLDRLDNTVMDWSKEKPTDQASLFAKPRLILKSPYKFQQYGECGRDVSELFPHLATCVDDLAFVRSITTDNPNHAPAIFQMNTGFILPGSPSMGAWLTYGLGTENQNLPAFVVLPDFRKTVFGGVEQWASGFLPASHQGTVLRWSGEPIPNLHPPQDVVPKVQETRMDLLRTFNQEFTDGHFTNPDLDARMDAYELAYRMQTEVPGALSIEGETQATREMYGLEDSTTRSFGTRCLMARRLVEKGVRFVQLYTPSQSWDSHTEIEKGHRRNAEEVDKPIAALLKDLKQRGLIESTLVVWMGEFGRTPDNLADLRDRAGRDHNPWANTIWLAGGGIKKGIIVGETDDLGLKAVQDVYHVRDVHTTILHLMGLNDIQLTYYHAGRNRRLTDTGGRLISQILS